MASSLIHLLSYISLASYIVGLFDFSYYLGKRFITTILALGLLSQILILILVLDSNLAIQEESIRFTLNFSWLLMFCSMLILLTYVLTEDGSPYHARLFFYFSFLLLIMSLIGFHLSRPGMQYELKPLLSLHIVVSILSQVSVYFVYCLSLLVLFLNKLLKNKTRLVARLPSLVPTHKLLQSGEYIAALLLICSILTGLFITEIKFDGVHLKYIFSLLFLFVLFSSILARKYFKLPAFKLNYYNLLAWTLLLSLQGLYKLGFIN